MSNSMNQQVILITGASSGIGKATALELLSQGAPVYAAARRAGHMQDLAALGAHILEMDVTDELSMKFGVNRILQEKGHVDVLVNNAGYAVYGAVEDVSIDDARRQFEVNLFGLARLTQLVLPTMRGRGKGRIINISSMGGKIYTPLGAWYHASKFAVEGWSDCLRLELRPFGIDVVVIEPGLIRTAFGEVMNQPMLERTGKSPYADLAAKVSKATDASYADGGGSEPDVIARVIARAIKARRPRTRYVAGSLARPLIGLRRLISDRSFDRLIMSQVK